MTSSNRPPNVLLISSDQQHPDLLGCINPEVRTPHLDQLAAEGTRFNRTYCPNPTCTPTRASIITGLYPSQHGAYSLGTRLPEHWPTLGAILTESGYSTSLIGKAHFQPLGGTSRHPSLESYPVLQDLEFWRQFSGPWYGFEHIELARNHADEPHVGQHYALWLEERDPGWRRYFQPPTGSTPTQRGAWNIPDELHYNTWIVERTMERFNAHSRDDQPFFLWASFPDPHPPYLAPEPWASMYHPDTVTVPQATPGEHNANPPHFGQTQEPRPDFSRWASNPAGNQVHGAHSHCTDRASLARDIATYYGMMSSLDHAVGRILENLEALGMANETLVVFTSDHGHFYGQHGLIAKGPFHYEDLVRVPFIVRWPGVVPENHQNDALQSLVDLAPTLLAATGARDIPPMAGLDLSSLWRGETDSVRDHVLVENRHQPDALQLHTYIDSRYKLTVYRGETFGELFDLEADPEEVCNRWDDPDYGHLKTELLRKLVQAEMMKEPLPMPRVSNA